MSFSNSKFLVVDGSFFLNGIYNIKIKYIKIILMFNRIFMRISYWKWINVIVDFYNKILNVRKLEKNS